jgi:hypothetical protein
VQAKRSKNVRNLADFGQPIAQRAIADSTRKFAEPMGDAINASRRTSVRLQVESLEERSVPTTAIAARPITSTAAPAGTEMSTSRR